MGAYGTATSSSGAVEAEVTTLRRGLEETSIMLRDLQLRQESDQRRWSIQFQAMRDSSVSETTALHAEMTQLRSGAGSSEREPPSFSHAESQAHFEARISLLEQHSAGHSCQLEVLSDKLQSMLPSPHTARNGSFERLEDRLRQLELERCPRSANIDVDLREVLTRLEGLESKLREETRARRASDVELEQLVKEAAADLVANKRPQASFQGDAPSAILTRVNHLEAAVAEVSGACERSERKAERQLEERLNDVRSLFESQAEKQFSTYGASLDAKLDAFKAQLELRLEQVDFEDRIRKFEIALDAVKPSSPSSVTSATTKDVRHMFAKIHSLETRLTDEVSGRQAALLDVGKQLKQAQAIAQTAQQFVPLRSKLEDVQSSLTGIAKVKDLNELEARLMGLVEPCKLELERFRLEMQEMERRSDGTSGAIVSSLRQRLSDLEGLELSSIGPRLRRLEDGTSRGRVEDVSVQKRLEAAIAQLEPRLAALEPKIAAQEARSNENSRALAEERGSGASLLQQLARRFEAFEPRLAALEPKVESVKPQLQDLATKFAGLPVRLQQLEGRLGDLEPRLEVAQAHAAALEPQLRRMEPKLSAFEPLAASLEKRVAMLEADVPSKSHSSSLDTVSERLRELHSRLDDVTPEPRAAALGSALDALGRRLDSLEAKQQVFLEIRSELGSLSSRLDALDAPQGTILRAEACSAHEPRLNTVGHGERAPVLSLPARVEALEELRSHVEELAEISKVAPSTEARLGMLEKLEPRLDAASRQLRICEEKLAVLEPALAAQEQRTRAVEPRLGALEPLVQVLHSVVFVAVSAPAAALSAHCLIKFCSLYTNTASTSSQFAF
jgi:chromosome segregation ATPase